MIEQQISENSDCGRLRIGAAALAVGAVVVAVPGQAAAGKPQPINPSTVFSLDTPERMGATGTNGYTDMTIAFSKPKCHVWNDDRVPIGRFSGWCDGRGPKSYRARIACNSGADHQGQWRWLGDHRGSTAYCSTGRGVSRHFEFDR